MLDDRERELLEENAVGSYLAEQMLIHVRKSGALSGRFVVGMEGREYEVFVGPKGESGERIPGQLHITVDEILFLENATGGIRAMKGTDDYKIATRLVSRELMEDAIKGSAVLPGMHTFQITEDGREAVRIFRAARGEAAS
jgi:hypothetical protein